MLLYVPVGLTRIKTADNSFACELECNRKGKRKPEKEIAGFSEPFWRAGLQGSRDQGRCSCPANPWALGLTG